MSELSIEPFANAHLDGLVALVVAEGRSEYAGDVERTSRAPSAPGVTTVVPIDDGRVVGARLWINANHGPAQVWGAPQAGDGRSRGWSRLDVEFALAALGLARAGNSMACRGHL